MFASVLIIVLCSGLLAYWFRYSCILLLRSEVGQIPSLGLAVQGTFSFAEIQEKLGSAAQLDPLHSALQRDYQVLTYLVRHASRIRLESFEEKLLVWDYRVMQFWYKLTKTAAPDQARQALREMASVLNILAARIGQRAGLGSEV